ncbi:unnamed protein product [Rotaria magnacalcarata]|uniref:Reverse transcriptase domain-containing protein n=1 Tax=Rotaria magnacalcarata TaxID=392030 RepID=A0A816SJV2_9BILA|nr:unnamed protein product [Rotaria magnacalcarata]
MVIRTPPASQTPAGNTDQANMHTKLPNVPETEPTTLPGLSAQEEFELTKEATVTDKSNKEVPSDNLKKGKESKVAAPAPSRVSSRQRNPKASTVAPEIPKPEIPKAKIPKKRITKPKVNKQTTPLSQSNVGDVDDNTHTDDSDGTQSSQNSTVQTDNSQTIDDIASSQCTTDVRTDESTDSDGTQSSQDKAVQTDTSQAVDESSGDDTIQTEGMNDQLKNKTFRPNKKQYQNRRHNKKDKFKQLEIQIDSMNKRNLAQDERVNKLLSHIDQLNLTLNKSRNCESYEKHEAAKDKLRVELNLKYDNFNEYEQSVCNKLYREMNITIPFDEINTNVMEYLMNKTESICKGQKINKDEISQKMNDNKTAFEARVEAIKKNLINRMEQYEQEQFDIFANMVGNSGTKLNWWVLELGVLQRLSMNAERAYKSRCEENARNKAAAQELLKKSVNQPKFSPPKKLPDPLNLKEASRDLKKLKSESNKLFSDRQDSRSNIKTDPQDTDTMSEGTDSDGTNRQSTPKSQRQIVKRRNNNHKDHEKILIKYNTSINQGNTHRRSDGIIDNIQLTTGEKIRNSNINDSSVAERDLQDDVGYVITLMNKKSDFSEFISLLKSELNIIDSDNAKIFIGKKDSDSFPQFSGSTIQHFSITKKVSNTNNNYNNKLKKLKNIPSYVTLNVISCQNTPDNLNTALKIENKIPINTISDTLVNTNSNKKKNKKIKNSVKNNKFGNTKGMRRALSKNVHTIPVKEPVKQLEMCSSDLKSCIKKDNNNLPINKKALNWNDNMEQVTFAPHKPSCTISTGNVSRTVPANTLSFKEKDTESIKNNLNKKLTALEIEEKRKNYAINIIGGREGQPEIGESQYDNDEITLAFTKLNFLNNKVNNINDNDKVKSDFININENTPVDLIVNFNNKIDKENIKNFNSINSGMENARKLSMIGIYGADFKFPGFNQYGLLDDEPGAHLIDKETTPKYINPNNCETHGKACKINNINSTKAVDYHPNKKDIFAFDHLEPGITINGLPDVQYHLLAGKGELIYNSKDRPKTFRFFVGINKLVIEAEIDSGSQVSSVSRELVEKLKLPITSPTERDVTRGITGNDLITLGYVDIELILHDIKFPPFKFHVIEHLAKADACSIGENFLYHFGLAIDPYSLSISKQIDKNIFWKIHCNVETKKCRRTLHNIPVTASTDYCPKSEKEFIYPVDIGTTDITILNEKLCNCTDEVKGEYENKSMEIATSVSLAKMHKNIKNLDIKLEYDNRPLEDWENSFEELELPKITDWTYESLAAKLSIESKDEKYITETKKLIYKYRNIFSKVEFNVPSTLEPMHIELTTDIPIYIKQYPMSNLVEDSLCEIVDEMLKAGTVVPSESPYNFPILAIRKKEPKILDEDGKLISKPNTAKPRIRLVLDSRRLNEIFIPVNFQLPRLDVLLRDLGNFKYFNSLDLVQAFYQLPLSEASQNYFSFQIRGQKYKLTRSPMGHKSTPGYFQKKYESRAWRAVTTHGNGRRLCR